MNQPVLAQLDIVRVPVCYTDWSCTQGDV